MRFPAVHGSREVAHNAVLPPKSWAGAEYAGRVASRPAGRDAAPAGGGISPPAFLTDHYELTMLQAALASGTANRRTVFEVFARRLPDGRRYGVVAGVGRALDAIEAFRFDDETLAALDGVVDAPTLEWLSGY